MTAIERYAQIKQVEADAQAFISALQAHTGEVDVVLDVSLKGNPEVRMPRGLKAAVEKVAENRLGPVLTAAMNRIGTEKTALAAEARDEYAALMAAAGLTP